MVLLLLILPLCIPLKPYSDSVPGSVIQSKFLSQPNRERTVLTREETGGENDVPHPTLASNLPVEVAGHIARDAASQGIQQDGC